MQKLKYNGWYNYETWNLKLWLDNDEGTYNMVQEKAKALIKKYEGDHIEDAATELEKFNKAETSFADWLKEYTLENIFFPPGWVPPASSTLHHHPQPPAKYIL